MVRHGSGSHCRQKWIVPTIVALAALAGCDKGQEIPHYQVPKEMPIEERPAAGDPAADNATPTDRMLTAIVPHEHQAWFFKLAGPIDAVDKQADAFESFVKTVSFPESAGAKPKWKLPEGWEESPEHVEMRYATVTIPTEGERLKLTISTPLPWRGGDKDELLLNVNRWRDQLQLSHTTIEKLANDVHPLKPAEGEAENGVLVVDLKGRLTAGGMKPPFANMAGRGALPAGHPPIDDSKGEPAKTPPANMAAKSPAAASQGNAANSVKQADLPLTFNLPEGWKQTPPTSTFVMLAFSATVDAKPVAVTISQAMGGTLANVNRWRGQVGLPPVGDGELGSVVHPFKVDGLDAQMVRLFGPEGADDRKAIMGAIVPQGEVTWFFKMMGPADAVEHEQTNFEKFVDSVKFRGEH